MLHWLHQASLQVSGFNIRRLYYTMTREQNVVATRSWVSWNSVQPISEEARCSTVAQSESIRLQLYGKSALATINDF